MSAVMYAYRVAKKDFWTAMQQVRDLYFRNDKSVLAVLIKGKDEAWLGMKPNDADFSAVSKAEDAIRFWLERHPVKFQVFEYGRDYVLRPIEDSYFFLNNHELVPLLRTCFYDDRQDIPPGLGRNLRVLDRVDELIRQHRYFIYVVYDKDSVFDTTDVMYVPTRKEAANES